MLTGVGGTTPSRSLGPCPAVLTRTVSCKHTTPPTSLFPSNNPASPSSAQQVPRLFVSFVLAGRVGRMQRNRGPLAMNHNARRDNVPNIFRDDINRHKIEFPSLVRLARLTGPDTADIATLRPQVHCRFDVPAPSVHPFRSPCHSAPALPTASKSVDRTWPPWPRAEARPTLPGVSSFSSFSWNS